ncbi:hypothetical protein CS0771_57410 [Catellatospora sp. IY07-71]|nr:hypothetical protein CS0771_57410 [Catellatospora sp. IY07-71]
MSKAYEERDPDAARGGVVYLRQALAHSRIDAVQRENALPKLAAAWRILFDLTGDFAYLGESIGVCRTAASTLRAGSATHSSCLLILFDCLRLRVIESPQQADLDQAISIGRQLAAAMPEGGSARPEIQNHLSHMLRLRFKRDRSRPDLEEAIKLAHYSVAGTSAGKRDHLASSLSNLALALTARFILSGSRPDLNDAISVEHRSIDLTAVDDRFRAARLSNLSNRVRMRYTLAGDLADLREAIAVARAAVASAEIDHPNRALCLVNLASALFVEAGRAEDPVTRDEAIGIARAALAADRDSASPSFRHDLSLAFAARYRQLNARTDLDCAIEEGRAAVAGGNGDDSLPKYMSNLGVSLQLRYGMTGDRADLDEAVELGRAAVGEYSAVSNADMIHVQSLGVALETRFRRYRDSADLDESIRWRRILLAGLPGEPGVLTVLAATLKTRFEHRHSAPDLDEAISLFRAALASAADGDADRVHYLSNLGAALVTRCEHTGETTELQEAITLIRTAAALVRPDERHFPGIHANLNSALGARFELTGSTADLDAAVESARTALSAAAPGHPHRASCLANLGVALAWRYERTGSITDLDEAIGASRESVQLIGPGDPDVAALQANLAVSVLARFERTGQMWDIDDAVRLLEEAVSGTALGHHAYPMHMTNLSIALAARFDKTESDTDLDRSISTAESAVADMSEAHPLYNRVVRNLSAALERRHKVAGTPDDHRRALDLAGSALSAAPDGHPDRARCLANLAQLTAATGALADIDAAVELQHDALRALPSDHLDRASLFADLGGTLRARFALTGDPQDRKAEAEAFRQGSMITSAPPHRRAYCGRRWAEAAANLSEWDAAQDALSLVFRLLPQLVDHGLDTSERRRNLDFVRGLGPLAAAAHLSLADQQLRRSARLHHVEAAWQGLEAGRGVLLGQAMEARSGVEELRRADAGMAEEMEQLRIQLGGDLSAGLAHGPIADAVTERYRAEADHDAVLRQRDQLARRWEALLQRVRGVAGFEEFGLPPSVSQMRESAGQGTVVAVTVAGQRSDALILTAEAVDHVPLPDLSHEDVVHQVERFLAALYADDGNIDAGADDAVVSEVLAWLWDTVAEPIMNRLGYHGTPDGPTYSWPRIWWMPSGLLSLLPLHAAGYHNLAGSDSRTVHDRVVSSYTTTARSLHAARQARDARGHGEALIVGVNEYLDPAAARLNSAEDEACAVADTLPVASAPLLGEGATLRAVREKLLGASWAHFSCHGVADLDEPSNSHLALYDGELSVRMLGELDLRNAYLAYLSACTTAANPRQLPDEPIHLASAFQLAGYTHVVATLWPVLDTLSLKFAERIYRAVAGGSRPDVAVHDAVTTMRAKYASRPRHWASHVHFGP